MSMGWSGSKNDLELRRLYNRYKQKEYFYRIGLYQEQNKTDKNIRDVLIQKGLPALEVLEAINEFNDFMQVLEEKGEIWWKKGTKLQN